MLELNEQKSILEGELKLSDCETHYIVKWLSGSPQASFYVGEKNSGNWDNIKEFIFGEQICEINLDDYFKYLDDVQPIISKYGLMYYGPLDHIKKAKNHFSQLKKEDAKVVLSYNYERYIRIISDSRDNLNLYQSKYGRELLKNGSILRNSFVGAITKIKITKKDQKYQISLSVVEDWKEKIMKRHSKMNVEKMTNIYNSFMSENTNDLDNILAAEVFGIRFAPLMNNNNISAEQIVLHPISKFNSEDYKVAVEKGIKLSPMVIWESRREAIEETDTINSPEDYIKFKKLLGWFVKQLNINNDLEDGEHTSGQGYKDGASIREYYSQWRDYGTFTLDCNIMLGFHSTYSKSNYINKTDSGINIRPLFNSDTKEVIALYLDLYEEEILSEEEIAKLNEQKYDIAALSLFDKCEPNDLLKELFDKYKELIERENYEPICISKIKYKTNCLDEIKISDKETIKAGRNRIFFGAPGTGKSHELDKQVATFVGDDYERVTFHPEYNHSGFFGTYKPIPNPQNPEKITYAFIAGPFLRVLTKALVSANTENNKQPYVLLIEEINRANMAAVFGEVFQLLDRESDASSEFLNASKYFISPSEDVKKYLVDEFSKAGFKTTKEAFNELRIPDNMFIWASMNSADQGVFPMDTAFKRRWEFEYFNINKNENLIKDFSFNVNGEEIKWNALRKAINQQLTKSRINEDKLMGPFFIGKSVFKSGNNDEIIKTINNKVIMYLFEDAARQKRPNIFEKGNDKTYYQICENFKNDGIKIFTQDIVNFYEINIKQKES